MSECHPCGIEDLEILSLDSRFRGNDANIINFNAYRTVWVEHRRTAYVSHTLDPHGSIC